MRTYGWEEARKCGAVSPRPRRACMQLPTLAWPSFDAIGRLARPGLNSGPAPFGATARRYGDWPRRSLLARRKSLRRALGRHQRGQDPTDGAGNRVARRHRSRRGRVVQRVGSPKASRRSGTAAAAVTAGVTLPRLKRGLTRALVRCGHIIILFHLILRSLLLSRHLPSCLNITQLLSYICETSALVDGHHRKWTATTISR